MSLNSLLSHFYHVHLTTSFVCWYNLKIAILPWLLVKTLLSNKICGYISRCIYLCCVHYFELCSNQVLLLSQFFLQTKESTIRASSCTGCVSIHWALSSACLLQWQANVFAFRYVAILMKYWTIWLKMKFLLQNFTIK